MIKKLFHAIVNTQMMRFLQGKNKDNRPKKAKNINNTSATFIDSSNLEKWEEREWKTIGTESHSTGHSSGIITPTGAIVKDGTLNTRELYILLDIRYSSSLISVNSYWNNFVIKYSGYFILWE